jgi:hypothetical protein
MSNVIGSDAGLKPRLLWHFDWTHCETLDQFDTSTQVGGDFKQVESPQEANNACAQSATAIIANVIMDRQH